MPPQEVERSAFSDDVCEFIRLLVTHGVRFLVVGGEAVIFYGHVRLTGDVDFFYDARGDNIDRLYAALDIFWSGEIPGVEDFHELAEPGKIIQFGLPPNRIDLLNRIDGVGFEEAWADRTTVSMELPTGTVEFAFIGLASLVRNKEAAGRIKDQEDLRFLRRVLSGSADS